MKVISIMEHYENETSEQGLFVYDKLPKNIRDSVDTALSDPNKYIYMEYEEGLQSCYGELDSCRVKVNVSVEISFMGEVEFYAVN